MGQEKVEKLRELVENRVQQALERGQGTATDVWARLQEQGRMMQDFLVPFGRGGKGYAVNAPDTARVMLGLNDATGNEQLKGFHPNGLSQLAARLDIPGSYLREIATGQPWEREAAADLLNKYAANADPQTFLVRCVGDEARAVMSDKYRRMDTVPVFGTWIKQAYAMGAKLYDGAVTDLRSHMEVLLPEVVEVEIANGDPVHLVFGSRISTSDFGHGSLEVKGFFVQGACMNGMVRTNMLRQIHIGRRMEFGDLMSLETLAKDTEAIRSTVGDVVKHLLSLPYREQTVRMIQAAAGMEVNVQQEVKKLAAAGLNKAEVDEVDAILAGGRYEDGVACGPSAWKVVQGITAVARTKDADRSRELQDIGQAWLDRTLGGIEAKLTAEAVTVAAN